MRAVRAAPGRCEGLPACNSRGVEIGRACPSDDVMTRNVRSCQRESRMAGSCRAGQATGERRRDTSGMPPRAVASREVAHYRGEVSHSRREIVSEHPPMTTQSGRTSAHRSDKRLLSRVQKRRKVQLRGAVVLGAVGLLFLGSHWEGSVTAQALRLLGLMLVTICILGRAWCILYIGGRKTNEL